MPAASAALASVVFTLVAAVVSARSLPAEPATRDRVALETLHDHAAAYVTSRVLAILGFVTLTVVLWYLFRATRSRRPALPAWLEPLIWFGPVLLGVGFALGTVDQLHVASDFVKGPLTEQRANRFIDEFAVVPRVVGQAGAFALAASLVMVSLNAMRVGLLTRFLGIIGVIIGAMLVLPILPGQVFQIFWLGALAAIYVNRYPGGRGRAWETGEAEVWPSAAELRRAAARQERSQETVTTGGIEDPPLPEPDEPEHPTSKKKRKKRKR